MGSVCLVGLVLFAADWLIRSHPDTLKKHCISVLMRVNFYCEVWVHSMYLRLCLSILYTPAINQITMSNVNGVAHNDKATKSYPQLCNPMVLSLFPMARDTTPDERWRVLYSRWMCSGNCWLTFQQETLETFQMKVWYEQSDCRKSDHKVQHWTTTDNPSTPIAHPFSLTSDLT